MRGVVWRSEEVEVMKLWQNLLRFWPVTFADSLVQPQGALQAHGGGCLTSLHAKLCCLQDYTQDTCKLDMAYMLCCLVALLVYVVCGIYKVPRVLMCPVTLIVKQRNKHNRQSGLLKSSSSVGMADMAQELYKQLECHIQQAKIAGQTICFGGHSLGGALATLICCHALLQLRLNPQQVQCVTFGSPPVLAHRDGRDGNAILQVCLAVHALALARFRA